MSKKHKREVNRDVLAEANVHPEHTYVKIGANEYLFLLNGYGMKLAREDGHDPVVALFGAIKKLAPAVMKSGVFERAMGEGRAPSEKDFGPVTILNVLADAFDGEVFDDLCVVVLAGTLTAEPNMTLDRVMVNITPAAFRHIFTKVWPRMLNYAQDLTEEDVIQEEEGGESAGDSGN